MESLYADVLATVVENGRLTEWSAEELEAQVDYEARERGLSDTQVQEAVAWASAHAELRNA